MGLDTRSVFITQPIDGSTRSRLAHATDDPQTCAAWLAAAGLSYTPVADRTELELCVVTGAGVLRDVAAQRDPRLSPARPMMACPLTAAIAIWRRQSVEPAAREILGADVRQIDHLGVYACRNIYNQPNARQSAHARAAAIDIAGFRLSDGRRVTVEGDWPNDSAQGRFLRRIRDDACRLFGTTLSPDYNTAHANHLHLEAGRMRVCS